MTENPAAVALVKEHEKALGLTSFKFSSSGYPDMGNGRYASTLSYADWYSFANAQRAHYKYVEEYTPVAVLHGLAGIYFPLYSSILGAVWLVGKETLSSRYMSGGPEARYGGLAAFHALATLGFFGLSIAGGLKLAGLVSF